MPKLFGKKDVELLRKHLKAIAAVEFFTVPVYLTGVYSFTTKALSYSPDGGKTNPLYDVQQKTLSVAVQEMYHLQLACNLANAFDVTPEIPKLDLRAGKRIKIPHLETEDGKPLTAKLGNLPELIKSMIAIETPDPNKKPAKPNAKVVYHSIADLYRATLDLLEGYLTTFSLTAASLDPHFDPGHNQIAYGAFQTRYNYNKIDSRSDVKNAANAIADQGEGNVVAQVVAQRSAANAAPVFRSGQAELGEGMVAPPFQSRGGRFANYDQYTHYRRFEEVQSAIGTKARSATKAAIKNAVESQDWEKIIGGPVFYPDGQPSSDQPAWAKDISHQVLQDSLTTLWSYMINVMQAGFESGNLDGQPSGAPGFFDVMLSFKYTLPLIWQKGFCPSFVYREGVTADDAQKAMDTVDPLCLYHWDAATAQIRAEHPDQKNACQGLNACAGLGWGGVATAKGTGACATADFHSCQGSNSAADQGGCGFLSTNPQQLSSLLEPAEQWIPGQNQCAKKGGCQTPISPEQVFDRTAAAVIDKQTGADWTQQAKDQLDALVGTNVWDRARTLLAQREGLSGPPALAQPTTKDGVNYDGTARRAAIQPTSK